MSLACEMYLFVVQEGYSNQCVWSCGLRLAAQYFIWTRFVVFFRFAATFNNEITVIEICIGLWSRPLILSGIGSPFTLLLVFQFSEEYKGKKKSVHFTTKCVQPFVNVLKNSVLNTGFSLTIAKPLINTVEQNHTGVFNYSGWINFNSGWSNQATWQHLCGWMKNDHACRC